MLNSLRSLMEILHGLPSTSPHNRMSVSKSQDIKLLLYYDEAHDIVKRIDGWGTTPAESIYYYLLACISTWLSVDTQVMAVFASTSSEIDPVITPTDPPVSVTTSNTLQAPLCGTPFDNSPRLLELNRTDWTLETSSTVEFMAQFGRPM